MGSTSAIAGGRYRVLGSIGRGDATEVYRAIDVRLDRLVALKVLRESYREREAAAQSFEDEARAMARVTHPNIVRVYDYDQANGRSLMVMEYVHGRTLKAYLSGHALPAGEEGRRLAGQLLEGLSAVRRAGITHTSVTPEDVLVTEAGTLKIIGLGIRKAVEAGGMEAASMPWALWCGSERWPEAPVPGAGMVEKASPREAEERHPGDRCVLDALVGRYRAAAMVATGGAGASGAAVAMPTAYAAEADTVVFPAIPGTSGRPGAGRTVSRASGAASLLGQAAVRSYLALGQTWAAVARRP